MWNCRSLHSSEQTEGELQGQLQEWKEYRDGVDVVLRAWDTYRRSEEARMHMQQYNSELALSRDEFFTIDEDINELVTICNYGKKRKRR